MLSIFQPSQTEIVNENRRFQMERDLFITNQDDNWVE